MKNFVFQNPTKLVFGAGQIAQLAKLVPADKKIMMTYGGGSILQNGVYDQVKLALKNHDVVEFGGIEANPDYETLMACVTLCREQKVDYLLAVGGGSVLDGTKFVAAAVLWDSDPWEFVLGSRPVKKALPMAAVLTLPATGSEMNNCAVISRRSAKEKYGFASPAVFPQFSILDPTTMQSLSKRQVANGIIDTFIHVTEQYMTFDNQASVQDYWAEGVLKTLLALAPRLMKAEMDYDSCANFMYAATMALNGFIAMGVVTDWATHQIGHELTALHGLDHGATLAIVYPGVMEVMRDNKREKLLRYAHEVLGIDEGTDDEKIDRAIAATEEFFGSLGVKTRLTDYGIGDETIHEIVHRFMRRGFALGEHGDITPEVIRNILNRVK